MKNLSFIKTINHRVTGNFKEDRNYYGMPTGRADSPVIDLYASDTTLVGGNLLGQIIDGENGKMYRYALTGASALVVGNMLQSIAVDTQFTNMAVPAAVATGLAAGSAVTITNGTTALTGGELSGGSLSVYTTPGLCEEYTILGNGAALSGAALNLYLDRPIRTAWTTSTKVNARYSPWYKVIQSPATTLTGTPAGNAIYATPAAAYSYIQTHGVGVALSDATSIIVGSEIAVPSGTAGAATLGVAGLPTVGYANQAAASGHGISVYFQID